jgi:hypothetical protein
VALSDYLRNFNLQIGDVARIRNRVMVVGQFNDDPEVKTYLFSHKCGQDPEYEASFAASCELEYRNFIQELKPSLREVVNQPDAAWGRDYAWFTLQRPSASADDPSEISARPPSVINEADYFFVRAASASDQERYQDQGTTADLISASEQDRGRQILLRVRKQLSTFSKFQAEVPTLVHGLMHVLSECAGNKRLPFYAPGGPLPGGLAEAAIELLFDEDVSRPLDLSRIAFKSEDGLWDKLATNPQMQQNLRVTVQAWRDRMRGKAAQYNDHLIFGQPIGDVIEGVIQDEAVMGDGYRKRFRQAQEAYSELRQILKNKALLGFVFQWLLDGYKDLDAVKHLREQPNVKKLCDAIESEVLSGKSAELPAPIRRMDLDERRRFGKALTSHFSEVVGAVLGREADLPEELVSLVDRLRADSRTVQALRALTGAGTDGAAALEKGFLTSIQDFLLGILCPALYREPGLTGEELADFRGQEVTNLYLAAVLLTRENVRSLRQIGEAYAPKLESRVGKDSKLGAATDIEANILGDVIEYLASDELVSAVQEAQRDLRSAVTARAADTYLDLKKNAGSGRADFAMIGVQDELADGLEKAEAEPVLVAQRAAIIAEQVHKAAAGAARSRAEGSAKEAPSGRSGSYDGALASILRAAGEVAAPSDAEAEESAPNVALSVAPERRTLDERVAAVLAKMDPESLSDVEAVKAALVEDEAFVAGVTRDQVAYYRGLNLIYSRYNESFAPKEYTYKVERLTLANIMLQLSGDLGLGKDGSYLYKLLLDMVVHTDRENPNQRDFLREVSLTEYVDTAKVKTGWFFQLEQTLANQGRTILDEVIGFYSDLRGIHYLFGALRDRSDAEIIVVNATAATFVEWVRRDNFEETGKNLLGVGKLATSEPRYRRSFVAPAMLYMTDAAFPAKGDKKVWLTSNFSSSSYRARFCKVGDRGEVTKRIVMPPLCLSVGGRELGRKSASATSTWKKDAEDLAGVAEDLVVPLLVVGPSPDLNRAGDGFPTILPAGYLLCAHLLGASGQNLRNPGLDERSSGRMYILGSGAADMSTSLQRLVWGTEKLNRTTRTGDDGTPTEELVAAVQPFAADFYLYLLLTLFAHAENHGLDAGARGMEDKKATDLFQYVVRSTMTNTRYRQSSALDPVFFWQDAMKLVLDGDPMKAGLRCVLLAPNPGANTLGKDELVAATRNAWFEGALRSLAYK